LDSGSQACLRKLKHKEHLSAFTRNLTPKFQVFDSKCVWKQKTPLLKIKNHSHPDKENLVPGILLNPILRTKNHLHPNKKPCAWNLRKSILLLPLLLRDCSAFLSGVM
jgi:hypothetical protein